MTSDPRLRLTVDLEALAANYRWLAGQAPRAACAAAVKANAYGLGLAPVARQLRAAGCSHFFAATMAEAKALRALLDDVCIYVLDGVTCAGDVDTVKLHGLVPVLNSFLQIALWQPWNGPCAIMIDTGIHRLGIEHGAASEINVAHLNICLWMSHLASADEAGAAQNALQLARFRQSLPAFSTPLSLANSAAILLGPDYHFDMVRPGIALYGGHIDALSAACIRTVVTAQARVLQVRDIAAGECVGYNATWTAARPTRVATLGIGYADGYLRGFSNRGTVFVNGANCPVIGRVSMDLTTIDVTDAPGVKPGDYAEMLGPNVPMAAAAAASGLSQYELLTSLGDRYERHYTGEVA